MKFDPLDYIHNAEDANQQMAMQMSHDSILKDFTEQVLKNVRPQAGSRSQYNSKYFKQRKGTQLSVNSRGARGSKQHRYRGSASFT